MNCRSLGSRLSLMAALCAIPITATAQTANVAAATTASAATSALPAVGTTPVTTAGGTINKLAKFDAAADITNSLIFDNGTNVGISTTSPSAKLDVNGGVTVRGLLYLPATGTATATGGKNSNAEDWVASVFNSGTSTAVTQTFQLRAEPVGNNTASASGSLNLLFGQGTSTPAETGVSFSKAGNLTAKQLISTIATGTAPLGVTSTTQVPNLNASLLGGFAPGAFAKLAGGNAFSGNQSVTGNLSATGTIAGGAGSFTLLSAGTGTVTGNLSVNGNFGTSGNGTFSGGLGVGGGFSVGAGETLTGSIQFTDDGTSNVQPSLMINAVDCCVFGNRMIWAHSPSFPFWGVYYDDNADVMRWQESFGVNEMLLDFTTGNLSVTGAITAGTKDFKIDHPLDPQNKFLYHGSVESSEMMNIYTGNAIMDNGGEAVISLPKWFEALNADFRYQLTAIGAAAPNLHVAQEIAHHQFSIAGGAPGMKVSWQVTGVRHDAYAKAHPLVVEVKKDEKERGHYLHPDAFGAPRLTQEEMLRQR